MTKQEEINDIKDCIASWQRQRDEMEMRYQGVRPSYVSTDLAILEERIERYKAKLVQVAVERDFPVHETREDQKGQDDE